MRQALYPLFGAGLTAAACTAAGVYFFRSFERAERTVLGFITGAALVSLLAFLLCAAGMAYRGVFLICGAVLIALAFRHLRWGAAPAPTTWPHRLLYGAIVAAYLTLYFFNALAPEISPDGNGYHLPLVARYARDHGFHKLTTNMYASLSQGMEMLFLWAYSFGRGSAAALMHFCFLLALAAAMFLYGRRFLTPAAGACAALFVFCSPIVGIDAISAYNDIAVAAVAVALLYTMRLWESGRQQALLVAIGLLAGFAFALKYTAGVAIPYALAWIAWRARRLGPPAAVAACAAVPAVPWLLKNWLWIGNPLAPFFNAWFPNPHMHITFERDYSTWLRVYELTTRWSIPAALTTTGTLTGVVGPLFWLAPLGLIALRWREGRQLWLAALVFGITYPLNIGARFVIPALPFIALAMGLVFTRSRGLAPSLVALHAVLSWPNTIPLYAWEYAWRLREIPVRAALRLVPEEEFISWHLPQYLVERFAERMTGPRDTIFIPSQIAEAHLARNILVGMQSGEGELVRDMLLTPLLRDHQAMYIQRYNFPARAVRRVRMVADKNTDEIWSISEIDLGVPVKAVTARPNRWDAPLALDGSLVTRWRAWEPTRKGMWFEADLGTPVPLDHVTLRATRDQYSVRLRVEADGQPLPTTLVLTELPEIDLRRAATEAIRRRGVQFLLIPDNEFGAQDLRDRMADWGLTSYGRAGDYSLYKIE